MWDKYARRNFSNVLFDDGTRCSILLLQQNGRHTVISRLSGQWKFVGKNLRLLAVRHE